MIIDGCKREYEVDGIEEIKRIKKLPCMDRFIEVKDKAGKIKRIRKDYPRFMLYTKCPKVTNNGKMLEQEVINRDKKKLRSRINDKIVCPMNALIDALDDIDNGLQTNTIPTENFIKHIDGNVDRTGRRHMSKIRKIIDGICSEMVNINMSDEDEAIKFIETYNKAIESIRSVKTNDPIVYNRLIEMAFGTNKNGFNKKTVGQYTKNTRTLLNLLYNANPELFLSNFINKCPILF